MKETCKECRIYKAALAKHQELADMAGTTITSVLGECMPANKLAILMLDATFEPNAANLSLSSSVVSGTPPENCPHLSKP